jgi:hypothetical protein
MSKQKLVICAKGFPNQPQPIMIDTTKGNFTIDSLTTHLECEFGLHGGKLYYKNDPLTEHVLREMGCALITYAKEDEMIFVDVDWESFGRSYSITIHQHDNLHTGIFSIPFMFSEKKYRFYFNNQLMESVNMKLSEAIDLSQLQPSCTGSLIRYCRIVAELYE